MEAALSRDRGSSRALYPVLITADDAHPDCLALARERRDVLTAERARRGALLFRGFGPFDAAAFHALVRACCDEVVADNGEHNRSAVQTGVFTPVFYPAAQKILWHNENSFNVIWPSVLAFCCVRPAQTGGETPLADGRAVYAGLPPEIRAAFERRGVMYVRVYHEGLGQSWRQLFATDSKAAVEERCRQQGLAWDWDGETLRTRSVKPAAVRHPVTGDACWTAQILHWHPSCLDEPTKQALIGLFGPEALPRDCRFADGGAIPDEYVAALRAVYERVETSFAWQPGDVLFVDNIATAHARNPYTGPRELLIALADPVSHADLQATETGVAHG